MFSTFRMFNLGCVTLDRNLLWNSLLFGTVIMLSTEDDSQVSCRRFEYCGGPWFLFLSYQPSVCLVGIPITVWRKISWWNHARCRMFTTPGKRVKCPARVVWWTLFLLRWPLPNSGTPNKLDDQTTLRKMMNI